MWMKEEKGTSPNSMFLQKLWPYLTVKTELCLRLVCACGCACVCVCVCGCVPVHMCISVCVHMISTHPVPSTLTRGRGGGEEAAEERGAAQEEGG